MVHCPWDFSGKNTGVGCHSILQGIFPNQGLNLRLLNWQVDFSPLRHEGSSNYLQGILKQNKQTKNTELFVCVYKITVTFYQWLSNWIYQTQRLSNLENLLSMLYKKLYTCCSFLVPLFLANYSSIFYDRSLFILAGSISKMHLHSTDAHLISAALWTECFYFHK